MKCSKHKNVDGRPTTFDEILGQDIKGAACCPFCFGEYRVDLLVQPVDSEETKRVKIHDDLDKKAKQREKAMQAFLTGK